MLRILLTITMLAALIAQPSRGAAMAPHSPDGPVPDQATITLGPIPAQFLAVDGELTLDLSTYVAGMISGTLAFNVSTLDTDFVTLSVNGSELTITADAVGQAEITVSLQMMMSMVSATFNVTVLAGSPWSVSDDDNVYLLEGNVGIGVDDPDERLVVDGRIKAEEIHVEDVTPADYVFDEDYDLMSLEELKEHIEIHGHLPGIASGAEMEAEGVSVSMMQTRLLEKVEELTLYTIDQHRKLASQRVFIDQQERQLAVQQQYIESLEQRLSRLELDQ